MAKYLNKDTEFICSSGINVKFPVAHHHIIPANQCDEQFPKLVKLGNYYQYDINNALNGISLPTMNKAYNYCIGVTI